MDSSVDTPLYPINMSSFLVLPDSAFDPAGIPYDGHLSRYHPTVIAQYALAHWNEYYRDHGVNHRNTFLAQAQWFVEHEVRTRSGTSGWPIALSRPDIPVQEIALSASAQGCAISVLMRAYQLTAREIFFAVGKRAIHTFEQDILDGGICAPLGEEGIFFEEVAVYPATHALNGCIFGLLGLYDYQAMTNDAGVSATIQRTLSTLHRYLNEFDVGYWTCRELSDRHLASLADLPLQCELLDVLAQYSGCQHCHILAARWRGYLHQRRTRTRYFVVTRCTSLVRRLLIRLRSAWFLNSPISENSRYRRVCITLPIFPMTGGILTVLEGIAQVTEDIWQLEYFTQYIGPQHPEKFVIHRFGGAKMTPWLFPGLWLYFIAGLCKLVLLLHRRANYNVILPQDTVSTGSFSALAARLAGVRVVCIDHGDLPLLHSRLYRAERLKDLTRKKWPRALRVLMQRLLVFYWPSRYIQAWIAARFTDHFLIPGIAGDGTEDICRQLRIPQSHVTRFASMINIDRHIMHDTVSRSRERGHLGIRTDAIVVAIICRLAPEKGLDVAIESIGAALATLTPNICDRVRIVIAGDGPLRKWVEETINARGVAQNCALWGDISAQAVRALLAISDIFLYTSVRGAYFPMAILEAMASGCAVIASTEPPSNAHLLAEGRGIVVSPANVIETSRALVRLIIDPECCRQMGFLAREYIAVYHTPAEFRRHLMRATSWYALGDMVINETKDETSGHEQ